MPGSSPRWPSGRRWRSPGGAASATCATPSSVSQGLEAELTDERRVAWLVLGPLFLREAGTGRELVRAAVDEVRRRSAVGALPYLLFHLARDEATTDRWSSAEATYTEAVRLARETGQTTDLAACLAGLAWLEGRQGRDERCRRHVGEAMDLCGRHHIHLFRVWCHFALGELELGLGHSAAAVQHLQQLSHALADIGVLDVDLSPTPELVDALLREGRGHEARDLVERYGERAADKGQPWAMARACRVHGEVGDEDAFDGSFQRALELHSHTLDGFETARTQLAYGVRLRRGRRRVEARPQLRTALETFERLGARLWADRAALELKATGETAVRRDSSTAERLTPQELQVALLLAEGRTTREAAAALFLSPKTVEYHLRHVYTKLGIGSRAELADAVTAIEHVEGSARRRPVG